MAIPTAKQAMRTLLRGQKSKHLTKIQNVSLYNTEKHGEQCENTALKMITPYDLIDRLKIS